MIHPAQFLRVHLHSVCSDDLGKIYMVTVKKVHTAPDETSVTLHSHEPNSNSNGKTSPNGDGSESHVLNGLNGSNGSDSQEIEFSNANASWTENMVERGRDLMSSEASGIATAAAIVVGAALIEIELIPGLVIGAGAVVLGKLFPEISIYARPIFKSIIKAGFSATHKIRQVVAETNEQVNDLVAEVKNEQHESSQHLSANETIKSPQVDLSTH